MPVPPKYVILYVEPGTDRWFRLERTPTGSFIDGTVDGKEAREVLEATANDQYLEERGMRI